MTVLSKWCSYSFFLFALALVLSGALIATGEKPSFCPTPPFSIEEKRYGVQKDLYHQQNGEKLHSRISCPRSTLKTSPPTRALIEDMEEIDAVLQYKFDNTGQEIRTFSADQGTYNYQSKMFHTDEMLLNFYREEGHLFPTSLDPNKAFLQGIASQVTFLIEGDAAFKAETFKALVKVE